MRSKSSACSRYSATIFIAERHNLAGRTYARSADRSLFASRGLARALQTKADDVERLLLHVARHFKPPFIPDLELILQISDVFGSNFGASRPLAWLLDTQTCYRALVKLVRVSRSQGARPLKSSLCFCETIRKQGIPCAKP